MSRMAGGESCMGFIHSKNLRAATRLIDLSVTEVNFKRSRCNMFFFFLMCDIYSLYLYLYRQLYFMFCSLK